MIDRFTTIERVALLQSLEFFEGAPIHVLASVAEQVTEIELAAGEQLMVEGDEGDCLYVVATGRVRIAHGDHTIAELGVGDVVGELSVLSPGPRSATAVVIDPGIFLRVGADVLDELLLDHPDVTRGVIEVLVRRLRDISPS
jgi:CRP-like cAMP-binding protein